MQSVADGWMKGVDVVNDVEQCRHIQSVRNFSDVLSRMIYISLLIQPQDNKTENRQEKVGRRW